MISFKKKSEITNLWSKKVYPNLNSQKCSLKTVQKNNKPPKQENFFGIGIEWI